MRASDNEWADQLKAAAIAFRRANRAPWQNAHTDRLAREREARRVAKEYRRTQREAERDRKQCRECGETKPATAFELLPSGGLRGICRDCRTATKSARKRAARATLEHQAELQRKARERELQREEREAAKAAEREELQAAKEAEWAALRAAEEARRRKRLERKRGVRQRTLSPERLQEVAKEVARLSSLLLGTNPRQRISDQQTWEATSTALQKLWLQSGDKECVACKATVPASAMLPPGPANFYPGKCQRCATAECHANQLRVTGRPPEGPRLIPMKDGTSITVAELARRCRERERTRRSLFVQKSEAE